MTLRLALAVLLVSSVLVPNTITAQKPGLAGNDRVFGYTDFSKEAGIEQKFLAVPNAKLAGEHLKTLTAEPHIASSPEDYKTAEYVAEKFRAAGLDTEIVPYRVLMNQPKVVKVEAFDSTGKQLMSGPTREHVEGDPFDGRSAGGDAVQWIVRFGRRDAAKWFTRTTDGLKTSTNSRNSKIDLHGKIVVVRYGANFRGVKVYIAEQRGAAGVIIYSDPQDDGYYKGDPYPNGPWRPDSGVQRGSVQYLFKYPGDPETPGIASTSRICRIRHASILTATSRKSSPSRSAIEDAAPILRALRGPGVPQGWQGALPFRYHLGPGGVRVHLVSQQDYQRRTIWDVIGKIKGTDDPEELGRRRQPSRRVGLRCRRSQQRHRQHARSRARCGRADSRRLEAEAHDPVLQLGCRRGRPDWLNRMGGAARQATHQRSRLLQR